MSAFGGRADATNFLHRKFCRAGLRPFARVNSEEWQGAGQIKLFPSPWSPDAFLAELLGGGDPLPIDAPGYSDLGDSLRHAGYHHFCIDVPDIEKAVADLRTRGVKIVTEPFKLDAISRKLAFFADPSGNLIELAEIVP